MNFSTLPRQPDEFQQPITAAQLTAICQRAFGQDVNIISANELSSGMFNTTFLIIMDDKQLILRISPYKGAELFASEHNLLRREYAIQPYLGSISHLTPRTIFADFSRELLNRDYVFQHFLAGELWDQVKDDLTAAESAPLWTQLAQIAQQIHQTVGERFGFPYPEKQFVRWSEFIINLTKRKWDDLSTYGQSSAGVAEFVDALQNGRSHLDKVRLPHLLHGDLWPKNVLIDRSGDEPQIVGLLDAERGLWGDPLAEWIFHYLELPDVFWQTYGRPADDPSTQFRMAAYHGMYSILLLLEAYRFKSDPEPFRTSLRQKTQKMEEIIQTTEAL